MKKLIFVAVLALVPSLASAQGVGEFLQGITDPHVVAGAGYNKDTKTWSAVITANVVGFKAGTLPLYLGGAGVSLNTVTPGLENAPFASVSLPFVTVAPWGEQVVIQVGMSTPIGGGLDVGASYYAGVGVSLSGGPNTLKAKRIKRIQAKEAQRKAEALKGGPVQSASN
jgi:hypothetical protein